MLLFVLAIGYRETAFAYAVSSAGVAHSVSKACGQGKLESCGCDPKSQRGNGGFGSSSTLADWRWSGCSHNMDFGVKFSRFLLDSRQRGQDIHSRIHLHNSHVGRTVSRTLPFLPRDISPSLACHRLKPVYCVAPYTVPGNGKGSSRSNAIKVSNIRVKAWTPSNPIIRKFLRPHTFR